MDVIFEPSTTTTTAGGGKSFSIEVGFFDTVLEMKEKIHKYEGVPVSKQTLIFNGQVLQDQRDVASYDIFMFSRVRLLIGPSDHVAVAAAAASSSVPEQQQQQPSEEAKVEAVTADHGLSTSWASLSPSGDRQPAKIQLLLRMPPTTWSSTRLLSVVEMDANDVVQRLKEKIRDQMMGVTVPLHLLALHHVTPHAKPGPELQDHKTLLECDLSHHSEIKVSIKPTPSPSHAVTPNPPPSTVAAANNTTTTTNTTTNNSNKKVANNNNNSSNNNHNNANNKGGAAAGEVMMMKVMVQPKCGTRKIPVEVNAGDNVGVLKKELGRLQEQQHFHLPSEGYFFIYKQNVMDDDRSFLWHHVSQGDTIEIFNGSVTGGC